MKMKIITMLATFATCFSIYATEYASLDAAYAAKDYAWIAATNAKPSLLYMHKLNWTDNDKKALAAAYSAAGWNNQACNILLHMYSKTKQDEYVEAAVAYAKKLLPDFVLPDGTVEIPYNTHIKNTSSEYTSVAVARFARYVNEQPEKVVGFLNFINLANAVVAINKARLSNEKIQLNLTDDIVAAIAKAHVPSYAKVIRVEDKDESVRLTRVYFNAATFTSAGLYSFALEADKLSKSTWFSERAFAKTTDCRVRTLLAISLNDPDKLLLALADMKQDTFTADDIAAIIKLLNGQKSDWRTADVKKVLLDINSMYTTKLYNDRDTWEPVLSKLRAMIEIR